MINPIKNKKGLEATIDDMRNSAYSYLEKYSSSKQQLRTYLLKKFIKIGQKTSGKKEVIHLIDLAISSLIDQKILLYNLKISYLFINSFKIIRAKIICCRLLQQNYIYKNLFL